MDKERKDLYTFGYGISLLIAFLLTFRVLHRFYGFSSFLVLIGSFIFLMFIITKIASLKPIYNFWILGVHLMVAVLKIRTGFSFSSVLLLGTAILVLCLTIIKIDLMEPIYLKWMKVAHFIGTVISGIILSVLFYIVFAPVGIFLRIIKKDLLNQNIEKDTESYWIKKEAEKFDPKRYQQQF